MSTSSGITACDELVSAFSELRITGEDSAPPRVIKISIDGVQLVETGRAESIGDWEADYEELVLPFLDSTEPCYILFRLDSTDANGASKWLFIDYVPDNAQVRKKMLYASTRASLRREFGDNLIADELHGSIKEEVSLSGYKKHLTSAAAPAPLRDDEREMEAIKKAETGAHISTSSKHEVASGVAFPMDADAEEALIALKDGGNNYVQLSIDIKKETIQLAVADSTTDTRTVSDAMPTDSPRYHFVAYPHEYEGESERPIFFIYSCPGYACKIKERMLYSSCKNHVTQLAEKLGLALAKKLEVGEAEDMSHDTLHQEIHPPQKVEVKKFLKPSAPGRGARRMHRDKSNESLNSNASSRSATPQPE